MEEEVFATPVGEVATRGLVRERGDPPPKPPQLPQASLDISSVAPQDAFEVFAGKVYQSTTAEAHRGSVRSGTTLGSGFGASVVLASGLGGRGGVAKGAKASTDPVSRYFRLRAELEDLEADLAALEGGSSSSSAPGRSEPGSGSAPGGSSSSGTAAAGRPSEVLRAVRNELVGVRQRLYRAGAAPALRALVGGDGAATELGLPNSGSNSGSGEASAALLAAVAGLQAAARAAGSGSTGSSSSSSASTHEGGGGSTGESGAAAATFELFLTPAGAGNDDESSGNEARSGRAARVAALEGRLACLEVAVGAPTDGGRFSGGSLGGVSAGGLVARLGRSSGGDGSANLGAALAALEARVARLEPETVAAARAALQPLQAALDQVLHEQKAFNATAGSRGDGGRGDGGPSEEARAVLALFRRTQAVDEFGPLLPALVARLRSLQGVHEASLGVLNRLAALEQSRQSVASDAARDRAALALLAGRLAANAGQVAENVAAVDARLAALNL